MSSGGGGGGVGGGRAIRESFVKRFIGLNDFYRHPMLVGGVDVHEERGRQSSVGLSVGAAYREDV